MSSDSAQDIIAGNLFVDPLPHGEAYVLSQILHGWPDRGAAQIISSMRRGR